MPLYRKRFKQPLSQQPRKESISQPFRESSRAILAVQSIPKFLETLSSPVYPEVFPRSASEPNESAFADDKFENGKTEIGNTTLTQGYNAIKLDELEVYSSEASNKSTQNLHEANKNVNNSEEKSQIQEKAILSDSHVRDLSNGDKKILPLTDKFYQSDVVASFNIPEKNNIDEGNKIAKKKKSNTDKPKTSRIENKTKSTFKSEFSLPSESLTNTLDTPINKIPYSRDHDTSLNSSKSSQMSINDTPVKEAYKIFLLEKKTTKNKENKICTQNSDVSLNDPVVKETYSQFMGKKEKFYRVNTPKGLTHYDKMKWLQEQRNVGVYVHCDHCDKIRYLEEINDPTILPDKWYCEDNTDSFYNKCEIPEEKFPLHVQADWIDNLYNAGSIVWARVEGYPWWPGMVDDDPNTECYYWLDDDINDTPSYYHVTFFDKKEVTRAWLKPNDIKSFYKEKNNPHMLPEKHNLFRKRIDFALKQANEALEMSLQDRLKKFSFLVRYKKPINKPRDVTIDDLKRKTKELTRADVVKEKRRRGGERLKGKKKQVTKGQKFQSCNSFLNDFEIPTSPTLANISLELFEDI